MKTTPEVDAVAKRILRSYCPGSWPIAWTGASEETRDGWRRTAKVVIRTLDQVRSHGHSR